jgi:glycosyltransferase involved in cell wall biosynthesis
MKKKVLFMVINMNVGGTEKALLNMISVMPKQEYEITIFMLEKYGEFLDLIPEWIDIKYLDNYKYIKRFLNDPPLDVIMSLLIKWKWIAACSMIVLYFISHFKKERSIIYKYLLRTIKFEEEYDVAVAYAGPMDFISFFVAEKVNARLKYQWIHFDIAKIGFNQYFANKIYKKFNKILVVSEEGKNRLINVMPGLKDKTETFRNVLVKEDILKMAECGQGFKDNFDGVRILTVGRLSKEKGQDLTIPVLSQLKNEGYNVRWYCIGEGKARKEYEKLISDYNVRDDFILLGSTPNPYPYMKECDLYIQPSRHEGFCITLGEAKSFNVPIICTDFTGANEQIKNNVDGILVKFDKEQMIQTIKKVIDEEAYRNRLKTNLEKHSTQAKDLERVNVIRVLFNE